MNTPLLRKIQRAIEKHPKNMDMSGAWVNHGGDVPCGTTGCIAGWAIAGASLARLMKEPTMQGADHPIKLEAQKVLKLTNEQADRLFFMTYWPDKWHFKYHRVKTDRGRAGVVIRRIEAFIKSKGDE